MILSQYCFFLSNKRGYYLFSTLFLSILQVDKETFIYLQECQKNKIDVNSNIISDELYSVIQSNGFLCRSYEEEFEIFRQKCYNARLDEYNMHLTIIPTMNCCFSCSYCFEKEKDSVPLSSRIINSIVEYIDKKKLKSLHVTWFGGEPLLAISAIEEFTKKIDSTFVGDYSSDLITTGFPVNKHVVEVIKKSHISEIQITIDGNKENHNKIKFTKGCKDTFTRVFDNIKSITSEIPDINCVIRLNITKDNLKDVPDIKKQINESFHGKNVWLSPSLVMNNGNICTEKLFNNQDFITITKDIWSNYGIPTKWIYGMDMYECAIRKPYSLVIMPDGSLYRCWEIIGKYQDYCVGQITEGGNISFTRNQEIINETLKACDPFLNNDCKVCPYLPICYGGCPMKYCKHTNNTNSMKLNCTSYKDNLDIWLNLYLDYKERMV